MTFGPIRTLLLLIALLSAGLASLWLDSQGHWRHLAWLPPAAMPPDLNPPSALALVPGNDTPPSYASVLERPLFAPDRRPPPPPTPPPPPPPPDPLAGLQIYGVFTGNTPGILARIEGKMRRLLVDQPVGGWTLTQIDGRTATFAKGDEKREFKLAYAPLGPRTPPAAPPAAANRTPGGPGAVAVQNQDDEARDVLRRRNEIRAARGLPMITQ